MSDSTPKTSSFFLRHEFAIRRIHSLLGIVPLGLYMVVHLVTNASFITGTQTFQRAVYLIHAPGKLLPVIEWALIFAPLVFHAIIGVWISKTGSMNATQYKYASNRRYVFQRITGIVALIFLFFHILHLHGWFHAAFWIDGVRAIGLGNFRPYNAGSTLAHAMNNWVWPSFYLIGVLSCVYHLANGLWTAGITWGLWVSAAAQKRASTVCTGFGILLAIISLTAWWAAVAPNADDVKKMKAIEDRMHNGAMEDGLIPDMPEKRWEKDFNAKAKSVTSPSENPAKIATKVASQPTQLSAPENSATENTSAENGQQKTAVDSDE